MSISFVVAWCAIARGVLQVALVGVDPFDRYEWQAQVSHALEETVEGCLVGDRTADDGGPVALMTDGQSVEPGRPVLVEVPREPDLVAPGLGVIRCRGLPFGHSAPRAC